MSILNSPMFTTVLMLPILPLPMRSVVMQPYVKIRDVEAADFRGSWKR